jgi:hypothetical protein
VLRIVGNEVREKGCYARLITEIAARAGCGRTTVQNSIRQASRLGLLTVQERRRQGDVNLPNVVRIVSREWVAWLKRGRPFGTSPPKSMARRYRDKSDEAKVKMEAAESEAERAIQLRRFALYSDATHQLKARMPSGTPSAIPTREGMAARRGS